MKWWEGGGLTLENSPAVVTEVWPAFVALHMTVLYLFCPPKRGKGKGGRAQLLELWFSRWCRVPVYLFILIWVTSSWKALEISGLPHKWRHHDWKWKCACMVPTSESSRFQIVDCGCAVYRHYNAWLIYPPPPYCCAWTMPMYCNDFTGEKCIVLLMFDASGVGWMPWCS